MIQISIEKKIRLGVFILLVIAIGIGFFLPIQEGSWQGVVGKIVLFILVFFGMYFLLFNGRSLSSFALDSDETEEVE